MKKTYNTFTPYLSLSYIHLSSCSVLCVKKTLGNKCMEYLGGILLRFVRGQPVDIYKISVGGWPTFPPVPERLSQVQGSGVKTSNTKAGWVKVFVGPARGRTGIEIRESRSSHPLRARDSWCVNQEKKA